MEIIYQPALALLEFNSIAVGIQAGDAMVKRAPIATIQSGTVQPGNYLVMVTGDVGPVEESVQAGQEIGASALVDMVFLPNVHPGVVSGINGGRELEEDDSLGVVETRTVASAILAADAGLKGAMVTLWQLRLADGLGGKGIVHFAGLVADVEAAVEIAVARVPGQLHRQVIIPQLHEEMKVNLATYGRFGVHFKWEQA
jgi:microcompartment protein CcmL/EutN